MKIECPKCKSENIRIIKEYPTFSGPVYDCMCVECNESFTVGDD